MADVIWDPVAGVPFSGAFRYKDCGDGTWAPINVGASGFPPVMSLSAQSAIANGVALDNAGVRNNHNIVVVTSAGVSAGTVTFQASQDGITYFDFPTPISVSTVIASHVYNPASPTLYPVRFLRAAITATIIGGTVTAWLASA